MNETFLLQPYSCQIVSLSCVAFITIICCSPDLPISELNLYCLVLTLTPHSLRCCPPVPLHSVSVLIGYTGVFC